MLALIAPLISSIGRWRFSVDRSTCVMSGHNRHVVDDLRTRGAVFVDELSEVPTTRS